MATEQNNLDRLKGKNPFSVPEGYLEGLVEQVMDQLPEQVAPKEVHISMMERIRPWLYMAAVFAGLGLFFKVFLAPDGTRMGGDVSDSLLVKTERPVGSASAIEEEEDADYLEYIEAQYVSNLLSEELFNSEDLK